MGQNSGKILVRDYNHSNSKNSCQVKSRLEISTRRLADSRFFTNSGLKFVRGTISVFLQASHFVSSVPSLFCSKDPATKPIVPVRMSVFESWSFSINRQTEELTRRWLAVNLTSDLGFPSHVGTLEMDSITMWKSKAFILNKVAYLPDETRWFICKSD